MLGKYNSHYSSDILAHLIAEPIPGNCYMWSAPHQPFVLPIRLRDFGRAYEDHIEKDESAPAIEETGAGEIARAVSDTMAHIREKLVEKLRDPRTKYWRVTNPVSGGPELLGIRNGQLYYLIKTSKSTDDPQTEDELKRPALTIVLGEGVLRVVEHRGEDYYCATAEDWERVTGSKPVASEPRRQ